MEDLPCRSLSLEGPLFQNKELTEPFGDSVFVPILDITHQKLSSHSKELYIWSGRILLDKLVQENRSPFCPLDKAVPQGIN